MPCYETLLRQINAHGPLGLLLLIALLGRQEGPGTYALDATTIPVSRHRRQAKVVRHWAAWGKDSDRMRSATREVNWSAYGSPQAT